MSSDIVIAELEGDLSTTEPKHALKSWKKKYRKMRYRFEQKMRESDQLFKEEAKATETARHLVEENDQLLDLLLDVNDCVRLPPENRFDLQALGTGPPSPSAVPGLESDASTLSPQERLNGANGKVLEDVKTSNPDSLQPESLAPLRLTIPSTKASTIPTEDLPLDLRDDSPPPPSFISPVHEDEYLTNLDTTLLNEITSPAPPPPPPPARSSKSAKSRTNKQAPPTNAAQPSSANPTSALDSKESTTLALRNPMSVYNWLRRNQPQVFLQDNESLSEKTGAKSSRGAGKRASNAAAAAAAAQQAAATAATANKSTAEPVEFTDEDGIVYGGVAEVGGSGTPGTGASGGKGKRKRGGGDDDGVYRPKGGGGGSRSAKRRKEREKEKDRDKDKDKDANGALERRGGGGNTPAPKRPRKSFGPAVVAAAAGDVPPNAKVDADDGAF